MKQKVSSNFQLSISLSLSDSTFYFIFKLEYNSSRVLNPRVTTTRSMPITLQKSMAWERFQYSTAYDLLLVDRATTIHLQKEKKRQKINKRKNRNHATTSIHAKKANSNKATPIYIVLCSYEKKLKKKRYSVVARLQLLTCYGKKWTNDIIISIFYLSNNTCFYLI